MSRYRKIAMIGGTAACALGIGFFMQRGQAPAEPVVQTFDPAPIVQSALTPVAPPLDLREITLTSALPDDAVPGRGTAQSLPRAPVDPVTPSLVCDVFARAEAAPMAMVRLSVSAPCLPNERLTVHHHGMMFSAVTDATGLLSIEVPALAPRAVFVTAFGNGEGAVAKTQVPDLHDHDRVALQWTGASGFQIHAREFGADYGEAGHVWAGADATKPATGIVTRLGDADTLAPRMAEVYTFPRAASGRTGIVSLSVEAEVTQANCGQQVEAQSLEMRAGGGTRTRDVILSVPGCDSVGGFMVLNNLVDDLKIAAN